MAVSWAASAGGVRVQGTLRLHLPKVRRSREQMLRSSKLLMGSEIVGVSGTSLMSERCRLGMVVPTLAPERLMRASDVRLLKSPFVARTR